MQNTGKAPRSHLLDCMFTLAVGGIVFAGMVRLAQLAIAVVLAVNIQALAVGQ